MIDDDLLEGQDQILAAELAALFEADAREADGEDPAFWLDPDTAPPAEVATLTSPELDDLLAASDPPAAPQPVWPLSYGSPDADGGGGWLPGFADGGPLDALPPGVTLAAFADNAHEQRDGALGDDSLIGVVRAWRRLTSWAQARELAAIAALARRRPADGTPPAAAPGQFPARLSEFIAPEVAAALTLTNVAAEFQLDLALDLADRPATAAALETGEIDLPRARILVDLLGQLDPGQADAVEARILPRAGSLTTGQLRAALEREILAIDPDAARRRRQRAERQARVEHYADPEGTGTLTGRNLPPAQALAASKRLTQVATFWKKQGALGGMDLLRAHAYLALLNGLDITIPPSSLLPVPAPPDRHGPGSRPSDGPGADADGEPGTSRPRDPDGTPAADGQPGRIGVAVPAGTPIPASTPVPAGLLRRGPGPDELPPLTGLVNLTVPLTTLLGAGDSPGEIPGQGPVDADTARVLACALAGHRATRWQIIVTAPDGTALATGVHRGPVRTTTTTATTTTTGGAADKPDHGWTITVTAEPIATAYCDHRKAEPGYRASPTLQRMVRARTTTCTGPGCRRPAARCDLDHTVPHGDGGITCECNQAPLCRYCHRLKQSQGWRLSQPRPGVMFWTTPAGRRYTTYPSKHPA